ncbi:MAG: hypothetical protein K8H88_27680, partial [Sandaracinaceae bacterium]|nr:hypothetical protein [Sandaracinaceae bacterium]
TIDASGLDGSSADRDAGVVNRYDSGGGGELDGCVGRDAGPCSIAATGCRATEICNNGSDDDCDLSVDEECGCAPGSVQPCFLGPPGHRDVGACIDGTQRCEGSGEFGTWGACTGGISPGADVCDGLDNDCNGCADDGACCVPSILCPGPGDPRVPDTQPFDSYLLRGELFYTGTATAWRWEVEGGPCEEILPTPTFTLSGANTSSLTFRPTLSGDYRVTMTVTTPEGDLSCTFIVHVAGPGLRVEACWDRSTDVDVDLYMHRSGSTQAWYSGTPGACGNVFSVETRSDVCGWHNCEAVVRGGGGRVDWGYASSPLAGCENGPHGAEWRAFGSCTNPRLDIDNNLSKSIGTPENINLDNPRDGETFRVMLQNFTGTATRPLVNVYCDGRLVGTYGAPPDLVGGYTGGSGYSTCGAMWRVVDVTTHVAGGVTTCDLAALHPPGSTGGYWVTYDDPRF